MHTLDTVVVKSIISRGYNGDSSIPKILPHAISVVAKSLVMNNTTKLSKHDWKMEKQADPDTGPIITLINNKALLQHVAKEVLQNESLTEISERFNDDRRVIV